jgi:hypothetical protein
MFAHLVSDLQFTPECLCQVWLCRTHLLRERAYSSVRFVRIVEGADKAYALVAVIICAKGRWLMPPDRAL